MQNQDENIRVLELETREIQRQIDLLRKQVPDKANIESSLVDSQIEVCFVTFILGLDQSFSIFVVEHNILNTVLKTLLPACHDTRTLV